MAKRDDRTTELHDYDYEPSLQNAETNWENLIEEPDTPLEDVPNADELEPDSPVDPSAPAEFLHGTDLLNGTDRDEDEG
ncbi:hypothetical protein B4V02_19755 [Paenibacillus kribbensis]|uniref:Uncharacterized protein n=1 Tax=Paenibacillus kribbensis TaxID=172713 RepID=A0A222WQ99_9BACL|nr:hypothetical protein [Paenibacillus kribbensis]ASR48770.1 hypothetical protein B4V02_19755 [Paenibacillus kribbensis]